MTESQNNGYRLSVAQNSVKSALFWTSRISNTFDFSLLLPWNFLSISANIFSAALAGTRDSKSLAGVQVSALGYLILVGLFYLKA
ncbi:hypothetical protein R3P38DRAFT_3006824 [Favolaschia claudopus]|uniref:Uncharacterized protein n=1 Tax=Favolaschia claudopus TaxID=2862362 RepID=A0AAW0AJK5_9AGAR